MEEQNNESGEKRLLNMFLRDAIRFPLLTKEEESIIVRRVKKGDNEATEKLINSNLRFVLSVASKYRTQGLPLMDIISEGCLGLIRATKTFEPDRNLRFLTYANYWIRQRIMNALIDYKKNELNSLDEPLYESRGETHKDLLTSKEIRLEDGISITSLLNQLTERERRIIELRFYQDMTYEETGLSIGLTKERVRQIELKALRKLRWKIQNLSLQIVNRDGKEGDFDGHQTLSPLISDHSENNRG
ncbi:MAG: sigma-70 family RNA polymerase sigma factor [Nitrospinae bacterium]|nr:sigma-70 family RNA polymerase sigma factor [Nitrospinota bacterium]